MDNKTLKEIQALLNALVIQGTNNARILAEISVRIDKAIKESEVDDGR